MIIAACHLTSANQNHQMSYQISRADLCNIRSFCDESMKLGTSLLNIIKVILRNGAAPI
jgi:hypothetical protein